MKRFATEYVLCGEDAENIVHDIFMEIWEKRVDFTTFTNPSAYLFVLLKNRCIDFIRRKTIEQQAKDAIQENHLRELQLKYASLEILNSKLLSEPDIEATIYKALETLPERCKEIFILNKIQGKKQKEIATDLQISVHTVESQMAIAYKKLREVLKDLVPLLMFFAG